MDGAKSLFESLRSWSDLERLKEEATPEGLYLECKTQTGIRLNQGSKNQIAQSLSAMSNASGGVILLGVSTTVVKEHGLDVISGLEPIGAVAKLVARLEIEIPQLTVPPIVGCEIRAIKKGRTDSGIPVLYVPQTLGDPVRTTTDQHFYFRGSDGDSKAPYEVIRRLFSATDVPDLAVELDVSIAKRNEDGSYHLPVVITNQSSAIARDVVVSARIENQEACLSINAKSFRDCSDVNPGASLFIADAPSPVHRGLSLVVGHLIVTMHGDRWPRRILEITLTLYADQMRARSFRIRANLKKSGLEVKSISGPEYLY